MRLSSTLKGLITGIGMIAISVLIYYYRGNFDNYLQYITYTVYIAGIIWSLVSYSRIPGSNRTFKGLFTEGFKCFIVVTLLMVVYTWIFIKTHPAMKEEMGLKVKDELLKLDNYTTIEIEKQVQMAKEYFLARSISGAIFGYLLRGSVITIIGTLFLKRPSMTNGKN
jgi:hypothetical protein